MKDHPLEIPYRLETIEDINKAVRSELITMVDQARLLHFAREKTFEKPQALVKARKKATKEFIRIDEEKIRDVQISFSEATHLPLISQHPLIIESMPWINDIIRHENLFDFFHAFPPDIRKRLQIEQIPELPTAMYVTVLAIRKLLKKELIVYVKAHRTATLSLL
mgnify:FL=1